MYRVILLVFMIVSLWGCVANKPIKVAPEFWASTDKVIGIYVSALPKVGVHTVGSQGVLDMAINSAANSGLKKQLESVSFEAYDSEIAQIFKQKLEAAVFQVKLISLDKKEWSKVDKSKEKADKSKKYYLEDLRFLKAEEGVDILALIEPRAFGAIRSYYGFIATSEPKGYFNGYGVLVDLDNNALLWAHTVDIELQVLSPWKQPPEYPNLLQAIDEAVEKSKSSFI